MIPTHRTSRRPQFGRSDENQGWQTGLLAGFEVGNISMLLKHGPLLASRLQVAILLNSTKII
jgi:hypothetical protein